MKIQTLFCKKCHKKTPHIETLDETFLSFWYCTFCGERQRPDGNSMVKA